MVLDDLGMVPAGLRMVLVGLGMVLVGLMAPAEDFPHHQHRLLLLSLNPGRHRTGTHKNIKVNSRSRCKYIF